MTNKLVLINFIKCIKSKIIAWSIYVIPLNFVHWLTQLFTDGSSPCVAKKQNKYTESRWIMCGKGSQNRCFGVCLYSERSNEGQKWCILSFFLQYINIYLYMFKYPCYHKLYLLCYGIDRVYPAVPYTLLCVPHFCIEYIIHVQTVKYLIHVQICFRLINYGERVYNYVIWQWKIIQPIITVQWIRTHLMSDDMVVKIYEQIMNLSYIYYNCISVFILSNICFKP